MFGTKYLFFSTFFFMFIVFNNEAADATVRKPFSVTKFTFNQNNVVKGDNSQKSKLSFKNFTETIRFSENALQISLLDNPG